MVLALLTVFASQLANTQAKSRRDIETRLHARSVLAAALLDSLLQTDQQQGVPLYERGFGGARVSSRALDAARQQSTYVAVVDLAGHVLAASRGFTMQARLDLRISAAMALVRAGDPYGLGNVLPYDGAGVINFAVPFSTPYGKRVFLTGISPVALGRFLNLDLRKIPGVTGEHNYVIDGNDTVIASTNPAIHAGYRIRQHAILSRSSGVRRGYYFDEAPLTNSTLRILLAAPESRLFASVTGWRKWLPWLIFAAFAVVAAMSLGLGSRLLRSAESELREVNARLAALNEDLEQANAALAHDALHDPLTGLPNRALLMDRLEHILERSRRDPAAACAVLFVDLDNFKLINDSLSHAVGDQLLIAIAERFEEVLRPADTVARIGGDEFVLVLDGPVHEPQATAVAERLLEVLAQPLDIAGHALVVNASIGIAFSTPGVSASDLLRNADIAMYGAKHRGKAGHALFDERMHRRVAERLSHENALRRAVEAALIEVHYQPIVELATGQIRGFEALARWPKDWPELPPLEFIPIAEESGLIAPLGLHVLRVALETLGSWRQAGLVADDVHMSVNISRRQLADPALPRQILSALGASGVPGGALRLEVTESTLMHEPEQMRRVVSQVRDQGVALYLDDFGTEYSSLASLLHFPLEALKIDRSFVRSLLSAAADSDAIVRGTIALAHGLGLQANAEGIEHPAELQRLTALGCEYGQGFLFSEPMEREQVESFLMRWSPEQRSAIGDRLTI
jgi:diguanylate cyclase (GGDEF)-like protein